MTFYNNNVLITGGSGFIGTNLVNYLCKKKYKVFNVDKISYCSTNEKFKIVNKKKYFFYNFNIKNKNKLLYLLKKKNISTIVHLASESHVDRSIDRPFSFIKENILSTTAFYENLRCFIKKNSKSVRIIHVSTDEVFGSIKKKTASEQNFFLPNSPYAASKASAEHIARSFAKTYGLHISIIRLCNNYGPYQFTEKFVPVCILNVINNKPIPVYGNGKNIREWMHVEDSCKAIELIIKNFHPGETFNVGSGIRVENIKIIKILNKIMKKEFNINYVKDRPAHDFKYSLNSKKFKKKYNWQPKYDLEYGLKNTLKWYFLNKHWVIDSYKKYKGERLGNL
jgi:dTDP-glucose 4,6-dehydratase